MVSEAQGTVRQGIIVGVGEAGAMAVASLQRRLQQRHGGVPIIRLMVLLEGRESLPDMSEEIERIDLSFDPANLTEPAKKAVSRWLPDWGDALADPSGWEQTRIGGRLALFLQADRVHLSIRDATNTVLNVATRSELAPRGLQVKDEGALDVYIIGALDEPFASGCFIDLAYLVADTLERETTTRQLQTTGVLFLPAHKTGVTTGMRSAEEIQALRSGEQTRNADTYAALKELDFFMDKRRYEVAYAPGLMVSRKHAPFTHSCYLVDSYNEGDKGMPDLDQRVEMVAEWLYQALASPLKDVFQSEGVPSSNVRSFGKIAAYSGLGLGAYFLPVNEMIETNAHRMGAEMVGGHLLRQARDEEGLPTVGFGIRPQDVQDALRDDASWEYKIAQYVNVPEQYFANIGPQDLGRLEGQVRRTFDLRLGQWVVRMRRGMGMNLGLLLDTFGQRLAQQAERGINLVPNGGLSLVQRLLLQTKDDMAGREQVARGEVETEKRKWRALDQEVKADRANHVAAVQTFGTRGAMIALICSAFALIIAFYYAQSTLLGKLDLVSPDFGSAPTFAAVLLFLGFLAALFLAGYVAYSWWKRTRQAYIETHRRRLSQAMEIELKSCEAEFYKRAQESTNRQIQKVVDFQMHLEDLRDWFGTEMATPRPLFNSPRFSIEESLIDQADLEAAYEEVVKGSLTDEIDALFNESGSFSKWSEMTDEEIRSLVLGFGRKKFAVLRETRTAEEMLLQHAAKSSAEAQAAAPKPGEREGTALDVKAAVRQRIKQLVDNSVPFLRYGHLDVESVVRPNLIRIVGYAGAKNADSLITQLLEDQSVPRVAADDRHQITCMTARHGLPLAAIGVVRASQRDYDSMRAFGQRPLHTQRTFLALSDLLPLAEGLLQPQMAIAMGTAYGLLQTREEDGHLTYEYLDELDEPVTPDLGPDKLEACLYLQSNPTVLRLLSKSIESETTARVEQQVEGGPKKGNRGLIRELRLYARRKREEKAIDDWEEIMIEEYVSQLER